MRLVNFKKLINNLIDLLNGTNNCRSSKSELVIYRIRVFYSFMYGPKFAVVHLIETILSIMIWEVERNFLIWLAYTIAAGKNTHNIHIECTHKNADTADSNKIIIIKCCEMNLTQKQRNKNVCSFLFIENITLRTFKNSIKISIYIGSIDFTQYILHTKRWFGYDAVAAAAGFYVIFID